MSKQHTRRALMLSAISLFILTSCTTTTASSGRTSAAPPAFCLIAQPIYWSDHDTPETIRQAKAHNAVGKKLCGWGTNAAAVGSSGAAPIQPPKP
jgi:hypothetical protein